MSNSCHFIGETKEHVNVNRVPIEQVLPLHQGDEITSTVKWHKYPISCIRTFLLFKQFKFVEGGQAIMSLQALEPSETELRLHIDVYSAQTGISRFEITDIVITLIVIFAYHSRFK